MNRSTKARKDRQRLQADQAREALGTALVQLQFTRTLIYRLNAQHSND